MVQLSRVCRCSKTSTHVIIFLLRLKIDSLRWGPREVGVFGGWNASVSACVMLQRGVGSGDPRRIAAAGRGRRSARRAAAAARRRRARLRRQRDGTARNQLSGPAPCREYCFMLPLLSWSPILVVKVHSKFGSDRPSISRQNDESIFDCDTI